MTVNNPKESVRFGKFLLVGVLNTLIDFGLMNLFTTVFKLPLVLAQALSFSLAVINSYMLNRSWIYPDSTHNSITGQFSKFLVINVAGLALRTITIPFIDRLFSQLVQTTSLNNLPVSASFLSHNASLAVVIPITLILNYLANRYWTFGVVGPSKPTGSN